MASIIFDVDGTLWDSTEIVAESWDEYLHNKEHMNITITAERLMGLFGQALPAIAAQLLPDKTEAEQLRIIDACCQAELYIVSNCQAGYIEVFLKSSGLGKYFRGHLCFGDTGLEKHDTILKLMDTYHLKDTVYVGDTMGDFLSCRKAGIPFVFASYGFGDVPEPDYRISRPTDLVKLFA